MAKLEKGMKMPNFKLDTVFGTEIVKDVTFEQLVDGKPTFFWFQRYIGCPPCRMDVHLLSVAHPEFVEKGANIVVVMQSKPEIVLRDMNGQTLPFHLVCDPTESLYKELEIGSWDPENRGEMNEEEQAIIGLSIFGGYNSKEIGKILGLKDNTVRSKKVRALEKMEDVLK